MHQITCLFLQHEFRGLAPLARRRNPDLDAKLLDGQCFAQKAMSERVVERDAWESSSLSACAEILEDRVGAEDV